MSDSEGSDVGSGAGNGSGSDDSAPQMPRRGSKRPLSPDERPDFNPTPRPQKRARPAAQFRGKRGPVWNKYIDNDIDEVEEGGDDEDEDDASGDDELGEAAEAAELAREIEENRRSAERKAKQTNKARFGVLRDLERKDDVHDIVGGVEARARAARLQQQAAREALAEDEGGQLTQQALLPTAKDPRLWMVKCKLGSEKEVGVALMNKFLACLAAGKPLRITAVVVGTSKSTAGTAPVFIEAYRESHVREAVQGVRDLYGFRPDAITSIPEREMTAVVDVDHKPKNLRPMSWVRVKRGLYKGDLAQVREFGESGTKVVIKLVPRLNLARLALTPAERKKYGRGPRPLQRLFKPEDVEEFVAQRNSAKRDRSLEILTTPLPFIRGELGMKFDNKYFVDGFLYTLVNPDSLEVNAQPTLDEIQMFRKRNEDGDDEDEDLGDIGVSNEFRSGSAAVAVPLRRGDNVVVVKGDLINLQGKVLSVNESTKTFIMKATDAEVGDMEAFEMPLDEVVKFFRVGEHVKVINGAFKGETGTVVGVMQEKERWVAILFTDTGSKEIKVFSTDLQLSTEVSTGGQSLSGYELYDLVQIGASNMGVVVHIGRDTLKVLTQSAVVQTVRPQELRGKRNLLSKKSTALDSRHVPIQVGEVVKVVAGPSAGMSGRIKHVYRAVLFLHSMQRMENSGVFVVRARHVVVAGTKARRHASASGVGVAGVDALGAGRGRGRGAARGRGRGMRDPMIGKTVRITRGRWQSFIGIAREVTDKTVQVEVHAKQKTFNVPKEHVTLIGDRTGRLAGTHARPIMRVGSGGMTPRLGSQTPALGSQTPMVGSQTPMTGSQTPMVGSQTPLIGSHTPMHGSQTPMMGSRTPMFGSQTPRAPHDDDDDDAGVWNPDDSRGDYSHVPGMDSLNDRYGSRTPGRSAAPDWLSTGMYVDVSVAGRRVVGSVVAANPTTMVVDLPSGRTSLPYTDVQPVRPSQDDHARVLTGPHAGDTMLVIGTDDGTVVLKSRMTADIILVTPKDVVKVAE